MSQSLKSGAICTSGCIAIGVEAFTAEGLEGFAVPASPAPAGAIVGEALDVFKHELGADKVAGLEGTVDVADGGLLENQMADDAAIRPRIGVSFAGDPGGFEVADDNADALLIIALWTESTGQFSYVSGKAMPLGAIAT